MARAEIEGVKVQHAARQRRRRRSRGGGPRSSLCPSLRRRDHVRHGDRDFNTQYPGRAVPGTRYLVPVPYQYYPYISYYIGDTK